MAHLQAPVRSCLDPIQQDPCYCYYLRHQAGLMCVSMLRFQLLLLLQ
jgi:hypothetical protein